MTMMDSPTTVTPVFDQATNIVLGNIYNYLKSQQGDTDTREITERLDRINSSTIAESRTRGANDRATQAALRGIENAQRRNGDLSGINDRATRAALKGIIGNQKRELSAGSRDRATQAALFGQLNKNTKNSTKMFEKFRDSVGKMLSGLTSFLKDNLNQSLKQQTDLARTMRKANLSAADKDKIQAYASGVMGDVEKYFGNLGVSRSEINDYLGDLIAGGKDITAMSKEQLASYVALRKGGVEFRNAYGSAIQSTTGELKGMVMTLRNVPGVAQAANETLNKLTTSELGMGGGYAKSLQRIANDAKATYESVGRSALLAEDMADVAAAQFKYNTNQIHRMSDKDLQNAPFLGGDMKQTWENYKKADTVFLASAGVISENLAAIGMSQKAGASLGGNVYSNKQVEENNKRNTTEGMLPHALSKAFFDLDESLGGFFGQLANRADEVFGDSADVGKLVGSGFKIVTALLSKIVFNTTGGILGIIFRIGSAALAIAVIKKIIDNKDKFKAMFAPVVDAVKNTLPPGFINTISGIFNTVKNIVSTLTPLVEPVINLVSAVSDKLSSFFSPLTDNLSGISGAISGITDSINGNGKSVVSSIFDYLDAQLPKIGEFFKDTVTPIAKDLLKFLSGLAKQLWENTIKPLIPDLWDLLIDNWPIVLGAFAVKFLPDLVGSLSKGLITTVLPKLVHLLAAHPIGLAIAAVVGGLAAGGKWLWDRHQEEEDARQAANDYAEAQKQLWFDQREYIKALEQYGKDSPETQRLEKILSDTTLLTEDKRKELAKRELTAKLHDGDAKFLVAGIRDALDDVKAQNDQLAVMQANLDKMRKDGYTDNVINSFAKKVSEQQDRAYRAAWVASQLIARSKDVNSGDLTIEDLREQASKKSGAAIKAAAEKSSVGSYYGVQVNDILQSDLLNREQADTLLNKEYGVISKNFGTDRKKRNAYITEEFTDAEGIQRERTYVDDEILSGNKAIDAFNYFTDQLKRNTEFINSSGIGNMSFNQLKDFAQMLPIDEALVNGAKDANDLLNVIADNISTDVLIDKFNSTAQFLQEKEKANQANFDRLLKVVEKAEESDGFKLSTKSIQEIAKANDIWDIDAMNTILRSRGIDEQIDRLKPMAKGGYVDKPTPAIVGEDGAEIILPLTKSKEMRDAIDALTPKQKTLLQSILLENMTSYLKGHSAAKWLNVKESRFSNSSFMKYTSYSGFGTASAQSSTESIFDLIGAEKLKLLREVSTKIFGRSSDSFMDFIDTVLNNIYALDEMCMSVVADSPFKKSRGDKHTIRKINYDDFNASDGIPLYDDEETVKKIINECNGDMCKSHAFYDIIVPNLKNRKKKYDESYRNMSNTDGSERISDTPAARALEEGAKEIGKPYILESLGKLGYVCNEFTNYALRKSGASLNGFHINQVSRTFESIMRGKDGYGQLKIRDDLTPDTAPPGMLFFQDSKNKDGSFSPSHVGLVYYGHKRLHSSGGASNFERDRFLATWQSNTGVVIDDFPKDSRFKFGELPALFVRADGTMADVSAYANGAASGAVGGLTASQYDLLDDIFGYRAGSVLDYTNRWLTKQLDPVTGKLKTDDRSGKDLEDFIDRQSIEEFESRHKSAVEALADDVDGSLKDKINAYTDADSKFKSEIYETQSNLLKAGMGVVAPKMKIPAEERVKTDQDIAGLVDKNVKSRGDILAALNDIKMYLKNISRKPTPQVSKPQPTKF